MIAFKIRCWWQVYSNTFKKIALGICMQFTHIENNLHTKDPNIYYDKYFI